MGHLLLLGLFFADVVWGITIKAAVVNSLRPSISSADGGSVFKYNYNAAHIPLFDGPNQDALLVRVQDLTNTSDPYSVGPSKVAFAVRTGKFDPSNIRFTTITSTDVILEPSSPEDALGVEDPRAIYDPTTKKYFLMYTAVSKNSDGSVSARLALATASNPRHAAGWTKHGYVFPQLSWSKSGALLVGNGARPSLLFWGDSSLVPGIQVSRASPDLLHYEYNSSIWLPTRANSWDSLLVEAGPMPLELSDGNFLFLYNSARKGYPSPKPNWDIQYNIGWVILDKKDPTIILQRSSQPILSPDLAWEKGIGRGVLGLTPNVVFVEGWQRYPGDSSNNRFLLYLGGADSVIGVAEVFVKLQKESNSYEIEAKVISRS